MVTMCRTGLSKRSIEVDPFYMDTLEHRASHRSPVWLHVVVQSEDEPSGRSGLIVDLSRGGAAVELDAWSGEDRGMLGLLGDGLRYLIPFTVVDVESTFKGALLHVKFEDVDPRCITFLAETLAGAEAEFEAAQKHLARRQA